MTERDFGAIFAKLALQLRWTDADAVTIKSYYEALQGCSMDALQASARDIAIRGVRDDKGAVQRKWFPTSAEWFQAAQEHQREIARKQLALPPGREEPWHYECQNCEDTGWIMYLDCDGSAKCGRQRPHAPHSYTDVCGCRATNKTFQRHHAEMAGAA